MKKFTLIELLIVVAIIAILVSIMIPSLGKAREMSKRAVCMSNMRQMYLAEKLYEKDHTNKMALGYNTGQLQMNYIYVRKSNRINQGLLGLYTGDNSGFLYCPSHEHLQHKIDTSKNPWDVTTTGSLRTSISSAPLIKYDDNTGVAMTKVFSTELDAEFSLFADILSSGNRLSHLKEGANTVKAAGNGKFINFDTQMDTYLETLKGSFTSSKNALFTSMWTYFSER